MRSLFTKLPVDPQKGFWTKSHFLLWLPRSGKHCLFNTKCGLFYDPTFHWNSFQSTSVFRHRMKGNVHLRTVLGGTKDTVSDSLFAAASGSSDGQESACNTGDPGSTPGSGRTPGEENGFPGELQSRESQKVRHNWVTNTYDYSFFKLLKKGV